jgi:hypothetical protein
MNRRNLLDLLLLSSVSESMFGLHYSSACSKSGKGGLT